MPRESTLALEFLGELHTLTGRFAKARRLLSLCRRRALALAPEGDIVAECDLRFALLAIAEREFVLAESFARRAVDLCDKRGMNWEGAAGYRLLARALREQGRAEEAAATDAHALSLLTAMGDPEKVDLTVGWWRALAALAPVVSDAIQPDATIRAPKTSARRGLSSASGRYPEAHREAAAIRRRLEHEQAERVARGETPTRAKSVGSPDVLDPVWARVGFVTCSRRMMAVLHRAAGYARMGSHVLVVGETGTGKELVANAVHLLSGRAGRLIPFNCASGPDDLIEAELFGNARGAFTGAQSSRAGLAHEADGGTLFLDELGDLSPRGQGTLLRFLDSGEARAIGSNAIRRLQLGIVAATQPSLDIKRRDGRFRDDLFFRVAQARVELPPLRRRREDIPHLIVHLWGLLEQTPVPDWIFGEEAMEALFEHEWPGNVRELGQFVSALRLLHASGYAMSDTHFDETLPLLATEAEAADTMAQAGPHRGTSDRPRVTGRAGIHGVLKLAGSIIGAPAESRPTRAQVDEALAKCEGSATKAAKYLGISRPSLYRILDRSDES